MSDCQKFRKGRVWVPPSLLEVRHLGRATLLVEQKNVDGSIVTGQKVDRPPRTIDLLAPLRQDLTEYMLATGRRAPKALLFPRPDGEPWRDTDYRNRRRRVFYPAAAAAGLATLEHSASYVTVDGKRRRRMKTAYDGLHPYDLRHSFASLLLRDGRLSRRRSPSNSATASRHSARSTPTSSPT